MDPTSPIYDLEPAAGLPENTPAVSFDQEITQLKSTLGSFWGSVRKQSQSALETSRGQLSQYANAAAPIISKAAPLVEKAKQELQKLEGQAKASAEAGKAASLEKGNVGFYGDAPDASTLPPDDIHHPPSDNESTTTETAATSTNDFFTRLQSNVQSTFHDIQHNLSDLQHNPQLANIQKSLDTQFHQLQSNIQTGIHKLKLEDSQAQYRERAEKALKDGEKYWKSATKDIGHFLSDAVRIVPPSDLSSTSGGSTAFAERQAAALAAGRKQGLLHRLRADPAIILVDPSQSEDETAKAYATFSDKLEQDGGIQGETWKAKIEAETSLPDGEGTILSASFSSLVPSQMSADLFWQRYFFRVEQIDEDENRRKQVLEGAHQQTEEEFSWEDDDEPSSPSTETVKPRTVLTADSPKTTPETKPSTAHTSPRNSSEGTASSYDMVNMTSGDEITRNFPEPVKEEPKKEDDGEDSDWE